jgi:hypothetical protein
MTTAHVVEFEATDIELGQTLVADIGRSKWELGDLANRVCPATNGDKEGRLTRFAAEIDLVSHTLSNYRMVSAAWPELRLRNRGSWSVYKELTSHPDRYDILAERDHWTVDALRERLDRRPTRFPPPPVDPTDDPDDGYDDPIDTLPPEPHPMEPFARASRVRDVLRRARDELLAIKHQVADQPEAVNRVIGIVRPGYDELGLELIETMTEEQR